MPGIPSLFPLTVKAVTVQFHNILSVLVRLPGFSPSDGFGFFLKSSL